MYYRLELNLTPDEVIVYLRKSQSDDPLMSVDEVLAKHESILDEWSEKHLGGRVSEENKYREVISGETIKDRPEINKVLRLIESPRIKAVLVVEPQRLTRGDLEDIGRLMKLFKHTNTMIITPPRTYDLHDEYDWDAFERELKRGNEYLEYTKKILNRGRLLSVSQGNYIAAHPPYGYERTVVMDGKRKCHTLKIKEDEANVVRMIFDMYVNKDMARPSICKYLDSLHITPPNGKYWSQASLKDMLENVHYTGKVRWNWRKTVYVVEDGVIKKTQPKSKIGDYLIYEGKHDAIISEELFNAAQEKTGRNPKVPGNLKMQNPFSGLIRCHCGRAMTLRTYKRPDGSVRSEPRLICDDQPHCNTGSCLFSEMYERVCAILEQSIRNFEIQLAANSGENLKMHKQLVENLESKLKKLNEKEVAQWEAQTDPDNTKRMPLHIFKQLNEKLLSEKADVQKALDEAYSTMPNPQYYVDKIITFQKALDALQNTESEPEIQNRLLRACIDCIEYNRQKPKRIESQQERYYDKERKITRSKSALAIGASWDAAPIVLNVTLKI